MAVYTSLNRSDIEAFLNHYDVGELTSFNGIAEGVSNTNYLLATRRLPLATTPYILTLFEKRIETHDLPFFMRFTEWLAMRGIACPKPIHAKDGQTVRPLKGKSAALISFLEGQGNVSQPTLAHMALLGEWIARMHLAAEGFPMSRRNALSLTGWRQLYAQSVSGLDEIQSGLQKAMEKELDFLERHWPSGLPEGVIHADLFPDNVFFTGQRDGLLLSGFIDFYFACTDFWAYDLMIALNAWCFDAQFRFLPQHAKTLLEAYERLRPLTNAEKTALPVLARGAAMRFLCTRSYDWLHPVGDAVVTRKSPLEYAAKLQFHQQVADSSEYGL